MYAYDKSYKPMTNIPIVTGATAYDDPSTGKTYILLFNESLYYGKKMDHSLFNPNQLRKYGGSVQPYYQLVGCIGQIECMILND